MEVVIAKPLRPATRTTPEPLWSVDDLAAYLAVPKATVYRWNSRQAGPPYVRVGKHARYRRLDVEAWLAGDS